MITLSLDDILNNTKKSKGFYKWWGSGFGEKKKRNGASYLERREIFYRFNILDNLKPSFFCFYTFGVRRSIGVLWGLQRTSDTYSMKTK